MGEYDRQRPEGLEAVESAMSAADVAAMDEYRAAPPSRRKSTAVNRHTDRARTGAEEATARSLRGQWLRISCRRRATRGVTGEHELRRSAPARRGTKVVPLVEPAVSTRLDAAVFGIHPHVRVQHQVVGVSPS